MEYISKYIKSFITCLICLMFALNAYPQLDETDPFKDNYLLGNSAEIFVIRAAQDTMEFKIIDAMGNINTGGLAEKPYRLELGEWGPLE
jgi:hypothetical protein